MPERGDWCGWRQTVDVKPNTHYIYGAWVAYEDTDVAVGVHAHLHDAEAKVLDYLNTSQSKGKEHKWLPMFNFCTTPPETKSLQIHLTMNGHGTVRHDGVLIAEVLDGIVEPMESRPIAKDDIAIWQVNPVVNIVEKNCHDTLTRAYWAIMIAIGVIVLLLIALFVMCIKRKKQK